MGENGGLMRTFGFNITISTIAIAIVIVTTLIIVFSSHKVANNNTNTLEHSLSDANTDFNTYNTKDLANQETTHNLYSESDAVIIKDTLPQNLKEVEQNLITLSNNLDEDLSQVTIDKLTIQQAKSTIRNLKSEADVILNSIEGFNVRLIEAQFNAVKKQNLPSIDSKISPELQNIQNDIIKEQQKLEYFFNQ